MTARERLGLFLAGAAGSAVVLAAAAAGLPGFGTFSGGLGRVMVRLALDELSTANAVAAVVFDYRGFDTLGEELILFAAVIGVALLLRAQRDESERSPVDEARDRRPPHTSDAVRVAALGSVGAAVTVGVYVVIHGHLSPGGGFQGGVVLATALVLVYLAGEFLTFERLGPEHLVEPAEAAGALAFVGLGLAGLAATGSFLENFLPPGDLGELLSAGTVPLANLAVGLEVAAGFTLLADEFLEQTLMVRRR